MKNSSEDAKKQDDYFKNNILNMLAAVLANGRPRFSAFLDEHKQMLAIDVLRHEKHGGYAMFGGIEDCEYKQLGIFETADLIDEKAFPIVCIKISHSENAKLSHRDFLGSLMGLSLKRESIGDIIIEEDSAFVFVTSDIAQFVLQNLDKVANTFVRVAKSDGVNLVKKQEYMQISGTVASMRLDCIVAFLMKTSRTIATEAITAGMVKLNCVTVTACTKQVLQNDTVVIRGKGKFIIDGSLNKTKKDRFFLTANKLL